MKQARSQTRRSAGCKGLWRGGRGLRYLRCADRCSGDALAGRAVKNGPGRHVRGRPPNKREAHQLTELQIAAAGSTAALGLFLPLVGWQTSPTQAAATQSGACGGAVLCRVHGGAPGTFATGREFFSMFLCKGHLLAGSWRLGSSSPTKLRERVLRILDFGFAFGSIVYRQSHWGGDGRRLGEPGPTDWPHSACGTRLRSQARPRITWRRSRSGSRWSASLGSRRRARGIRR